MATLESPTGANEKQEIAAKDTLASQGGAHVSLRPVPHGALGHYRVSHRCQIVNTQAANSRLFEVRNAHATRLLILLSLRMKWLQTGVHTAAIEDSLDVFKVTGFTAVDTTNTVTPLITRYRTDFPDPVADLVFRAVTVAGAAAGMTGGTVTVEASPFVQLPKWLLAAVPTSDVPFSELLYVPDVGDGEHPFVYKQNEGFVIQNRVLLGAAAASSVYIDCSVVQVTVY